MRTLAAALLASMMTICGGCATSISPTAGSTTAIASPDIPHFKTTNGVTQLVVHQAPFLMLGGELGNSTAAGVDSLRDTWPILKTLHLNTVIAPVYWEQTEPVEGRFDYTLLDTLVHDAREQHLHIVLLWFGVWKNSMSTYVPTWVKQNPTRFPRAIDAKGEQQDILTAFAPATLEADRRAFASLLRHLRQADADNQTVVMVQVENEIGMLPDAREHSPLANAAFEQPVPAELSDRIKHATRPWGATWKDLGEEVFTAWHYAKFIDTLVQAGKAEYPLPMYVNAALNRPGKLPGQYPSGGPLPHLLDVWRAGAPHLDTLSPDIYFFNFADWLDKYHQAGLPIFTPESMRSTRAAANGMYAIGADNAMGFSPFGIESIADPAHNLLGQTYGVLNQLMPEILKAQREGKIRGVSPYVRANGTVDMSPQTVEIDGYTLHVSFDGAGSTSPTTQLSGDPAIRGADLPPCGGLLYVTAPGEYTVIGTGIKIVHTTADAHVGLLDVDEWTNRNGQWSHNRWLNGDETNQGRDVHLYPGDLKMQCVRLYRF